MFKAIFTFIKSLFTSAEDLTGALDNVVEFTLLHTESWVDEAYEENRKKAEAMNIDQELKAQKLKSIRKSLRDK